MAGADTAVAVVCDTTAYLPRDLVAAEGLLYLRQEGSPGTLALIEASPDGYKEHGRFNPPDRSDKESWPHPVIAGGKLFVRDQDVLLCYNVQVQ